MPDFDIIVIGGGPAGYTAALRAAERGAAVALVEAEKPGGACVHYACIPTNIMLGAVEAHLVGREMDALGVFGVDERFNYARAAARKEPLIRMIADGITAALAMRRVQLVHGRAAFAGPDRVTITGRQRGELSAAAFVLATGTRWEPPALPGIAPERLVTADVAHSLLTVPAAALVLGGGPADTAFALEYAFLLAAAGSRVTLATPYPRLLPALDAALAEVAAATLTDAGVAVLVEASVTGGDEQMATVTHREGVTAVPAEIVVAADPRRPFAEGLNLAAAGVRAEGHIPVDRACRTNVPHVFAAGDVTGGAMLTNAAAHMGEVAGGNAAGGESVTRLRALPHLLHTAPEIGWIGRTETQARAAGYEVCTGTFDLGYNARAIALGARRGLVKVVAERELGEVLGVHAVGAGASEILAAAATAMQAEVTLADLAATVHWHPSVAEGLAEAARRAL